VVGQPAKSVRIKPGWESVAEPLDGDHPNDRGSREIPYELSDDLEVFDEFKRDLHPPDADVAADDD
jgi:maltose O-acetyltransferase